MTTTTPRRFYIDRNDQQDETIVRRVAVRRSVHPATHQVQPSVSINQSSRRQHHLPRVGKLVQSAIRRRAN
jgi:hypothetical protein